jgi:hypothetical protein
VNPDTTKRGVAPTPRGTVTLLVPGPLRAALARIEEVRRELVRLRDLNVFEPLTLGTAELDEELREKISGLLDVQTRTLRAWRAGDFTAVHAAKLLDAMAAS